MNDRPTLADLRETLDTGAQDLGPRQADTSRVVAVHERIRVVRRRRRAAAGLTVAAVLATVVGVGVGVGGWSTDPDRPGGLEVAGPPTVVGGQRIPDRVTVLGQEYAYTESVPVEPVDGLARVELPRGDDVRAVSLVGTGLDGGTMTLREADQGRSRLVGDGVEAPVPLGRGATTLTVRVREAEDADLGLVVFERTDTPVDGVTDGTAWFRSTVADSELLAADFAEPGASSLEVRVSGRLDELVFSSHCRGGGRDVTVSIEVDGRPMSSGDCTDIGGEVGAGGASFVRAADRGEHVVRVSTSRGRDGLRAGRERAFPGVVLGLGVYREGEQVRVLGTDVDRFVEDAGRLWRLDDVRRAPVAGERVLRVDASDGPVLLQAAIRPGTLGLTARGTYGPEVRFGFLSNGVGGPLVGGVGQLLGGDRYVVRAEPGDRFYGFPPEEGYVLLYRPVS